MQKIGHFQSIPVYVVDYKEWKDMNTQAEEKIYCVSDEVFYHDQKIATLGAYNNLDRFDEKTFDYLRDLWAKKRQEEKDKAFVRAVREQKKRVEEKKNAETQPQRAERPVKETVEAAAAVDEFMDSWCMAIDNEIAAMKEAIAAMNMKFDEAMA